MFRRSPISTRFTAISAATPIPLSVTSEIASFTLFAPSGNAGFVEVRVAGATSGGRLEAGQSVVFKSVDLSSLTIISENGSESIELIGDRGIE